MSSDSPKVITLPPIIFFLALVLGLALQWFFPIHVFTSVAFRYAGWLLALASGLLALWAAKTMREAGTNIDVRRPAVAIVTSGPFRFTRNPLYLSLTLLTLALALFFDLIWAVVALVPALFIIYHGVIRREERYLETKFGQTYLDYKKKVRRWI